MNTQRLDKIQQRSFLTKQQYDALSPQQKSFAEEQFRLIYADEMSKLSIDLSHKKRILDNIHSIDEKQEKYLKEKYEKLQNKMKVNETQRNKKLEEKMKHIKQNDERWEYKMKEIQNRFRQQNRDAIEKAKKYRQQSQKFWKSKEKNLFPNSRTQFVNSKSRHDKNQIGSLRSSSVKNPHYLPQGNQHRKSNPNIYDRTLKDKDETKESTELLDEQLRAHQQRSYHIQKQREEIVFQKALQKLQKINKKREIAQKKQQQKIIEPTVPRKTDPVHYSINKKNKKNNSKNITSGEIKSLNRSKNSIEKLLKDHYQIKQRIEEEEFYQRGEKQEQSFQKNRKEKILKMIKNRVDLMKKEVIKNEQP